MSSRQERDVWEHSKVVGLWSAAKPTSTLAKADGSTRCAVSGTVAAVKEEAKEKGRN